MLLKRNLIIASHDCESDTLSGKHRLYLLVIHDMIILLLAALIVLAIINHSYLATFIQ